MRAAPSRTRAIPTRSSLFISRLSIWTLFPDIFQALIRCDYNYLLQLYNVIYKWFFRLSFLIFSTTRTFVLFIVLYYSSIASFSRGCASRTNNSDGVTRVCAASSCISAATMCSGCPAAHRTSRSARVGTKCAKRSANEWRTRSAQCPKRNASNSCESAIRRSATSTIVPPVALWAPAASAYTCATTSFSAPLILPAARSVTSSRVNAPNACCRTFCWTARHSRGLSGGS